MKLKTYGKKPHRTFLFSAFTDVNRDEENPTNDSKPSGITAKPPFAFSKDDDEKNEKSDVNSSSDFEISPKRRSKSKPKAKLEFGSDEESRKVKVTQRKKRNALKNDERTVDVIGEGEEIPVNLSPVLEKPVINPSADVDQSDDSLEDSSIRKSPTVSVEDIKIRPKKIKLEKSLESNKESENQQTVSNALTVESEVTKLTHADTATPMKQVAQPTQIEDQADLDNPVQTPTTIPARRNTRRTLSHQPSISDTSNVIKNVRRRTRALTDTIEETNISKVRPLEIIDEGPIPKAKSKRITRSRNSIILAEIDNNPPRRQSLKTTKRRQSTAAVELLNTNEGDAVKDVLGDNESLNEPRAKKSKRRRSTAIILETLQEESEEVTEIRPPPVIRQKREVGLQELLRICDQDDLLSFEDLIGLETLKTIKKVNESSFSEIFITSTSSSGHLFKSAATKSNRSILKIIPFSLSNDTSQELPTITTIYQELKITKTMSSISGSETSQLNFIQLYSMGICRGKYYKELLRTWDEFELMFSEKVENSRPDFKDDQVYAVLRLEFGGTDLEGTDLLKSTGVNGKKPKKVAEIGVKNILAQICGSIAVAEEIGNFEHRDLHWGNVLLSPFDKNDADADKEWRYKLGGVEFVVPKSGWKACIIDYTLSRLQAGSELFYTELDSEDFFTEYGDSQFDVYRLMRDITNKNWSEYFPKSNVLWLDYLCGKFLTKLPQRSFEKTDLKELKSRIRDGPYNSMREVVMQDPYFAEFKNITDI